MMDEKEFEETLKEIRKALKGLNAQEFMMYPKLLEFAKAVDFCMDMK